MRLTEVRTDVHSQAVWAQEITRRRISSWPAIHRNIVCIGGGGAGRHCRIRGPNATAQPAHQLQYIVGQRGHVSLAVHPRLLGGRLSHSPRSREWAQLRRSREAKVPSAMVWNGLATATFSLVGHSPVPLAGPPIDWVKHGQGEVTPFLFRWEAGVLDGAGLTILLKGHVLVGAASPVERAVAQDLALRKNQVVIVISEVPSGNDTGLLPGMDRDEAVMFRSSSSCRSCSSL